MRNAVFVVAVALILVGLVTRFTPDQANEPPPAAAKLGYVVLESRSPLQPKATTWLEPAAVDRGEPMPSSPDAVPAVVSHPIASAESNAPRQRVMKEVAKAAADAAKAPADVHSETLQSEPAETAANAGAPARRDTAAASAPVPPPAGPVVEKNPPLKQPVAAAASATNLSRPSPDVREAQTLLSRLGYAAGVADGIVGPRTQSALLSYQAANSLPADGVVSAALLARLRQDDDALKTLPLAPTVAEQEDEGSWSAFVSGVSYRIDRLFGREFDSVKRPEQLRAHCRANRDAWVYDSGRDKLVFCGSLNGISADDGSPHLLGR